MPAEEADEADKEEAAPKTKKETQWSWQLLNDNKAIWLRNAKDVDEEEYDKFYQTLSKVRSGQLKAPHWGLPKPLSALLTTCTLLATVNLPVV